MTTLQNLKNYQAFSNLELKKEEVIELGRQAGLVFNEEVHPLGILKHHRKALHLFAELVVRNNFEEILASDSDSENLDGNHTV